MSVPTKKLLRKADHRLRDKVFSIPLFRIVELMGGSPEAESCVWGLIAVCIGASTKYRKPDFSYTGPNIKALSRSVRVTTLGNTFFRERTLQDIINIFRGEYKVLFACEQWDNGTYWNDNHAGFPRLAAWLKEQGLTERDTLLVYPSSKVILQIANGGPKREALRRKAAEELTGWMRLGLNPQKIVEKIESNLIFAELITYTDE